MFEVNQNIHRLGVSAIETAKKIPSATLHEAYEKKGAVDRTIRPLFANTVVCGSALTVSIPVGDNLGIHVAITLAKPGDILVVTTNGTPDFGYWGEIMTVAATEKGIVGLVIDGCVRDSSPIHKLQFPIFAKGLCIRGTKKKSFDSINHPIVFGNVLISPGDLVLGDDDGLVVISQTEVSDILEKAVRREQNEEHIIQNLKKGKTTLELFGMTKILEENKIVI